MTESILAKPGAGSRRALELRACVLRQPGQDVAVETVSLKPPRRGDRDPRLVVVDSALAGVKPSVARTA